LILDTEKVPERFLTNRPPDCTELGDYSLFEVLVGCTGPVGFFVANPIRHEFKVFHSGVSDKSHPKWFWGFGRSMLDPNSDGHICLSEVQVAVAPSVEVARSSKRKPWPRFR
jgi:hypothetical protein